MNKMTNIIFARFVFSCMHAQDEKSMGNGLKTKEKDRKSKENTAPFIYTGIMNLTKN